MVAFGVTGMILLVGIVLLVRITSRPAYEAIAEMVIEESGGGLQNVPALPPQGRSSGSPGHSTGTALSVTGKRGPPPNRTGSRTVDADGIVRVRYSVGPARRAAGAKLALPIAFLFAVSSCSTTVNDETIVPPVSSIGPGPRVTAGDPGGPDSPLTGMPEATLDELVASVIGQLSEGWTPVPFLEADGTPAVTADHVHGLFEMPEGLLVLESFVWGAAGKDTRIWHSGMDGLSWNRWAEADTAFAGDRLGGDRLIYWGPTAWTTLEHGVVVVGATTTSARKPDAVVPTIWLGTDEAWEVEDLDWHGYLTDVIRFEGELVAVGVHEQRTQLVTSTDGRSWTEAADLGEYGFLAQADLDMSKSGPLRVVVRWHDEMDRRRASHFECSPPSDCRAGAESVEADSTIQLCGSDGPHLRIGRTELLLETPTGQSMQLPLPLEFETGYRDELWFNDGKVLADGRLVILGVIPLEPGNDPRGELSIWLHEPVSC